MNQEQKDPSQNRSQNPQMNESYLKDFSIVTAFNQLRKTQDQIYLARHRLDVLQTMRSRVQRKNKQEERLRNKSVQISGFIKKQKEEKQRYLDMRATQRQQMYVKNKQARKKHKQKLQKFRETLKQNNQWIHQQARKQRIKRQAIIKKNKNHELQTKYMKRQELYEKQRKRAQNIHQQMKHKRMQSIQRKEEQAGLIKNKIEQRSMILMHLQRKGSQTETQFQDKIQSQTNTISRQEKFDKTYGKKFIIKQPTKNQTTIMIK